MIELSKVSETLEMLNLTQVSAKSGIPYNTLWRIREGKKPSLDNYTRIVRWLKSQGYLQDEQQ